MGVIVYTRSKERNSKKETRREEMIVWLYIKLCDIYKKFGGTMIDAMSEKQTNSVLG